MAGTCHVTLREGKPLRSGRSDTRFSRGAADTAGPDTEPTADRSNVTNAVLTNFDFD
jgi:hypothetical protein